jgi:hypothetical protein
MKSDTIVLKGGGIRKSNTEGEFDQITLYA